MTKQLWKQFEGKVGDSVEPEFKELKENGIFWHYVKNDMQGEMLYNVLGDFQKGILYMSCELDGKAAYGRIDSPISKPKMVERAFVMDPDDALFCGWLSDMILCTQFEGCTEEQVLESWEDVK